MMELSRETVAGVIGAVIAVLLQITVAPAITLFEAVPNFIVAFCGVRAGATPAAPRESRSFPPWAWEARPSSAAPRPRPPARAM